MSNESGSTMTHERLRAIAVTAAALALIAVVVTVVVSVTTLQNRSDLIDAKAGRRIGVAASCAVSSSVIKAGREILTASVLLPGDKLVKGKFVPGPLTKQLGPSFPSYESRLANALRAADLYERRIVGDVIEQVKQADPDVQPPVRDGHLDCDLYAKAVGAG